MDNNFKYQVGDKLRSKYNPEIVVKVIGELGEYVEYCQHQNERGYDIKCNRKNK